MNSQGDYTFRRVAIRRKSGAYLPPGIPRPWSRPLPHSRRADFLAVPGQAAGTRGWMGRDSSVGCLGWGARVVDAWAAGGRSLEWCISGGRALDWWIGGGRALSEWACLG